MDPNETLKQLREKFERMKSIINNEDRDSDDLLKLEDEANRAVDLWNGLDQWMKKGGALPEDWAGDRGTP